MLMDFKACPTCGKVKHANKFHPNARTPDGLSTYCKPCQYAKQVEKQYGITGEDYLKMLEEQEGRCYLCGQEETTKIKGKAGQTRRLSVDHCHAKGHVRALLCGKCNTGLGYFRDDPQLLRKAADYLEEFKDGTSEAGGSGSGETSEASTEEAR